MRAKGTKISQGLEKEIDQLKEAINKLKQSSDAQEAANTEMRAQVSYLSEFISSVSFLFNFE